MRYEKEKQEVIDWLKHPNELGKEPSKIEFVKEFTDDDSNCLIFKYKKGLFSPWLLAIHSEAVGVFSEQEKYDEKRDIEQAKKLLDFLKQYWKSVAKSVEEAEKRKEKAKKFSGFVLKAEPEFEPDEFLKMYEEDWGERLKDDDGHEEKKEGVDARIFENENGLRLIIGYMDFRVPDNEAEENAIYNWMWKDAVATTEKHKAHEVVTIMGDGEIKEQAMFYAKAVLTLCRMENNIGVYANGVVYQPELFFAMEKCIRNGELPIPVLVWIGLGREEDGISAWTDGMKNFGFDEMEMIGTKEKTEELHNLMIALVDYCINNDVEFHDGDSMPVWAGLKIDVKKTKGVNVDEDGETLKISKGL